MKNSICLLLMLILSYNSFGQDYRCILNSGEQMFSNGEYFRAIKIDSVQEFTNFTSYSLFSTLGSTDENGYCYNDQHPSWIGSHVDVFNNGDHYFYNLSGDSILIKTNTSAGDDWICYQFDNGDYVRGQMMPMEYAYFLGQADSLKVIKFNAFDLAGNAVSNSINGKEIRISKSWGLVQSLNFKLFPDLYDYPNYEYINEYVISGMSEPQAGTQNLTIADIYDFDVGDEFHIYELSTSWLQEYFHYYEIHRMINKQWASDSIVVYAVEQCIRRHYVYSDTLILSQDTAFISINIHSHEDPQINEVPDKVLGGGTGWDEEFYWYVQHVHPEYDKICKTYYGGYFYEESMDCIIPMIDYDYSCYYLYGLGGPYWHYGSFGSDNYRGLVYFKKGNEEWGEPYDCDSLMVGIKSRPAIAKKIDLVPNPMQSYVRVKLDFTVFDKFHYQLFNPMGNIVREGLLSEHDHTIHRNGLPSGIYFLRLEKGGQRIGVQKLILR